MASLAAITKNTRRSVLWEHASFSRMFGRRKRGRRRSRSGWAAGAQHALAAASPYVLEQIRKPLRGTGLLACLNHPVRQPKLDVNTANAAKLNVQGPERLRAGVR